MKRYFFCLKEADYKLGYCNVSSILSGLRHRPVQDIILDKLAFVACAQIAQNEVIYLELALLRLNRTRSRQSFSYWLSITIFNDSLKVNSCRLQS